MTLETALVLPGVDPDTIRSTAALAEELGFDRLATGEHVMFPSRPTPSALATLAFAAAVTTRVRLLTAVVLAPLYPAALLAKIAACVDVLSQGRLDLGVGIGGEVPTEFEACGVPVSERGRRADEALAALRALWAGEDSFSGTFTRFSGGRLDLLPAQPAGPPLWVSGRRDPAVRRAARAGNAWMPYLYTPEQVADSVTRLAAYCHELGRDPADVPAHVFCFIAVDPDAARARRVVAEVVGANYRQDFTGRTARLLIGGTPAEVAARLQEHADAGASGIVAHVAAEPGQFAVTTRRLAEEVLPALRPH